MENNSKNTNSLQDRDLEKVTGGAVNDGKVFPDEVYDRCPLCSSNEGDEIPPFGIYVNGIRCNKMWCECGATYYIRR